MKSLQRHCPGSFQLTSRFNYRPVGHWRLTFSSLFRLSAWCSIWPFGLVCSDTVPQAAFGHKHKQSTSFYWEWPRERMTLLPVGCLQFENSLQTDDSLLIYRVDSNVIKVKIITRLTVRKFFFMIAKGPIKILFTRSLIVYKKFRKCFGRFLKIFIFSFPCTLISRIFDRFNRKLMFEKRRENYLSFYLITNTLSLTSFQIAINQEHTLLIPSLFL